MTTKTAQELLHQIQTSISVPKGHYNAFGKYKYRKCEDILEAAKKVMPAGCYITLTDTIKMVGDRYYVEATARFVSPDGGGVAVTGLAREEQDKKGMDSSQITGSSSSYARKYALNGLLAIDDSEDSDKTNQHEDKKPDTKPSQYKKVTSDEAMELMGLLKEAGRPLDIFLSNQNIADISQFPADKLEKARVFYKDLIKKNQLAGV